MMAQPRALAGAATVAPPRVANVAARIAQTDLPVFLTGEIGSGKSHLARWIHEHSRRASRPLIHISCATLPPDRLAAELFGSLDGDMDMASASAPRLPPLLTGDGGTLVLAAVDALPDDAQRRLLRLLTEGCVDVGPSDPARSIDLRVIATASADLGAQVASGRFRVDLYYRLRVVHLAMPPLRERRAQIEPLVRHFVTAAAGRRRHAIPRDLLDAMCVRNWPGNVRELKNACDQLVICCPNGELRVEDLPPELPSNDVHDGEQDGCWPPLPPAGIGLFELERRLISRVLVREKGNVTRAAAYLKIPRHILAYRITKYGLRRR